MTRVVGLLHVQPELWSHPDAARQPGRRVGGDAGLLTRNRCDAVYRHVELWTKWTPFPLDRGANDSLRWMWRVCRAAISGAAVDSPPPGWCLPATGGSEVLGVGESDALHLGGKSGRFRVTFEETARIRSGQTRFISQEEKDLGEQPASSS